MKRTLLMTLVGILALSSRAGAQGEPRFRSGAISWTPTLTLRDAGTDSNVYDEPADPKSDASAVFAPYVDALVELAAAEVRFNAGADFIYFQRYTAERAVNTRGGVRVDARGWRLRPFGRASFLDARERVNSEIDVRARRADRELGVGLGIQLTPRGTLEVSGAFNTSAFRQGEFFRGVDLANRLNRQSTGAALRFKYEITPLTRFVTEWSTSRDRFTRSPAYDANNYNGRVGLEFEPDALLKGRATVGVHRLEPLGELGLGFNGLTAGVELGYVVLQRTRFDVRLSRDTSYSYETQPYFLQTLYGAQVTHSLLDWLDVLGQASRETLDYPGIPERLIPTDTMKVRRYGAGFAIRPASRARMAFTYEYTERVSLVVPDRQYDRRRLFTTITYGF